MNRTSELIGTGFCVDRRKRDYPTWHMRADQQNVLTSSWTDCLGWLYDVSSLGSLSILPS